MELLLRLVLTFFSEAGEDSADPSSDRRGVKLRRPGKAPDRLANEEDDDDDEDEDEESTPAFAFTARLLERRDTTGDSPLARRKKSSRSKERRRRIDVRAMG